MSDLLQRMKKHAEESRGWGGTFSVVEEDPGWEYLVYTDVDGDQHEIDEMDGYVLNGIAGLANANSDWPAAVAEIESLSADRDRLAAEVASLRERLERQASWLNSPMWRGHPLVTAAQVKRDAAIAEHDEAVAERDEANMRADEANAAIEKFRAVDDLAKRMGVIADGIEPRGFPTPGACSCPSRDSVVNDTAEAIARWLDSTGRCSFTVGDDIRAGAWRGQNGGG